MKIHPLHLNFSQTPQNKISSYCKHRKFIQVFFILRNKILHQFWLSLKKIVEYLIRETEINANINKKILKYMNLPENIKIKNLGYFYKCEYYRCAKNMSKNYRVNKNHVEDIQVISMYCKKPKTNDKNLQLAIEFFKTISHK